MFEINAKRGFEAALIIAKNDLQGTCFLLDTNFKYSISITYNENGSNINPNLFDIQKWKIK